MNKLLLALFIIAVIGSAGLFLIVDSRMAEPVIADKLIQIVYPEWKPVGQRAVVEEADPEIRTSTRDIVKNRVEVKSSENTAQDSNVMFKNQSLSMLDSAQKGDPEGVRTLIRQGANINFKDKYGNTALNLAVMRGNTEVINTLLINGADPDIANDEGFTPTSNAARQRHEKLATMLLERGADPNKANNEGITPLMLASKYGHEGMVNLMIKHGASINTIDNQGRTALMYAAERGYGRIVAGLLAIGADKFMKDSLGQTAKDYAERFGHDDTSLLLR